MSKTLFEANYIEQGLIVSDSAVYGVFQLNPQRYSSTSLEEKIDIAQRLNQALRLLAESSKGGVEFKIQTTCVPFDVQGAIERMQRWLPRTPDGHTHQRSAWDQMMQDAAIRMAQEQFNTSLAWMTVKLCSRGTAFALDDIVASAKGVWSTLLGSDRGKPSNTELDFYRTRLREVSDLIGVGRGGVEAVVRLASANEIAWVMQRPARPDPNIRPTDAQFDFATSAYGYQLAGVKNVLIEEHKSSVTTSFVLDDGSTSTWHSASILANGLPDGIVFPRWMSPIVNTAGLPFPVEWTIAGTILSPNETRSLVKKRRTRAKDIKEEVDKTEQGDSSGMFAKDYQVLNALFQRFETSEPPMFFRGYIVARVFSPDAAELPSMTTKVKSRMNDHATGMKSSVLVGEQRDLLRGSIIGNKPWGGNVDYEVTDYQIAGVMIPAASYVVGDQDRRAKKPSDAVSGCYIGHTTRLSRQPVFFSPSMAPRNNEPGCVGIFGQPGGGKSFAAFNLAYNEAGRGAHVIYIDPKADATPLGRLSELEGATLINLASGAAGLLDPFSLDLDISSLSESGEDTRSSAERELSRTATQKMMARETIRLLLGGNLDKTDDTVVSVAVDEAAKLPTPSLNGVVEYLNSDRIMEVYSESRYLDSARTIGRKLANLQNLPIARLCFSPNTGGETLSPDRGLTVVTLLGIKTPEPTKSRAEYDEDECLGLALMYLLTKYAAQLMYYSDKTYPKHLFIDEAWMVMSSSRGRDLVNSIARMGRSHNTTLVFISQGITDLLQDDDKKSGLKNAISTWMCFRSTDENQHRALEKAWGWDEGRGSILSTFNNGEFLMRDVSGRINVAQFDILNQRLFHVFNTNPDKDEAKKKSAAAD